MTISNKKSMVTVLELAEMNDRTIKALPNAFYTTIEFYYILSSPPGRKKNGAEPIKLLHSGY